MRLPEVGNDYVAINSIPSSSCMQKAVRNGRLNAFAMTKEEISYA